MNTCENVEKAQAKGLPSPEEVEAMSDTEVEALVLRVTGWEWVGYNLGPNRTGDDYWVADYGRPDVSLFLGGDYLRTHLPRAQAFRQITDYLRQRPEYLFSRPPKGWSAPGEVPTKPGVYGVTISGEVKVHVRSEGGHWERGNYMHGPEYYDGSARFLYLSPLPKPPEASK